jgi:probable HAF family extracellular repeat protein
MKSQGKADSAKGGTMKSSTSILITATLSFFALAAQSQLAAQEPSRYKVIDLGTFGGPQSYVNIPDNYAPVINDHGRVAGWADTATLDHYPDFCFNEENPCFLSHAFQWQNGKRIDLGALSVDGSSASSWISPNGLIAGFSQNGETDPLIPGPPFFPELRAVLWQKRQIIDLGTLTEGGYESLATAVNSHGVVVGFATNTNQKDPNSVFGFGLQTRAFRWDKQNGMQDLGTLETGTDAVALLINERGQIVGESYINSTKSDYCNNAFGFGLTTGAFLWENGVMKNLGNFGGTCTFATDLNNRGEVVGISTLAGDQVQHAFLWDGSLKELPNTNGGNNAAPIAVNDAGDVVGWASLTGDHEIHASLWQNDIMTDLGTVDGDACSVAGSINARGQVVGFSAPCDFSQFHAFVWQAGSIADLNSLIPPDSSLYLTEPETINDSGQIAGVGVDFNGNQHAFVLIPCSADDRECQGAPAGPAFRPSRTATKPANTEGNPIRRMLRHRFGPLSKIPAPSTSSESGTSGIVIGAPAAEAGASKIRDPMLNSLDLPGTDRSSHFGTPSSCALYGRPCSPNEGSGYPRCCGTLQCVFSGGSTRAGYACK